MGTKSKQLDTVTRSRAVSDKSRNEKQKSYLLTHLAKGYDAVSVQLCEDSTQLIKNSQRLCERAKNLRDKR